MSNQSEEVSEEIAKWPINDRWCGQRNHLNRPAVIQSKAATMSWKRPGEDNSEGYSYLEVYVQPCEIISLIAKEIPKSGRGAKEVMIDLSEETAIQLRDLLLTAYPKQ